MLGRRHRTTHDVRDGTHRRHLDGPGLARGPALVIGTLLVAGGLAGLLENSAFPDASANFPDGEARGTELLGVEVNGWTSWLAIAAGALLLVGAAQHALAKAHSLLVGLVLGAAAVLALVDGDVLGLAAANGWTALALGIPAALCLLNVFSPRLRRDRRHADARHEPVVAHDARPGGRFARDADAHPLEDRSPAADPERTGGPLRR